MCLINMKKWTHFRYVKKIWNFSSLAQNGYKKGQLRISALASQRRLGVKENHLKIFSKSLNLVTQSLQSHQHHKNSCNNNYIQINHY